MKLIDLWQQISLHKIMFLLCELWTNRGQTDTTTCLMNWHKKRLPSINVHSRKFNKIFKSQWPLLTDHVSFCSVLSVPPDILDYPTSNDMVVKEGSNVTLKCEATGSPEPTIIFRREDGEPILLPGNIEGKWNYKLYYSYYRTVIDWNTKIHCS